MNPSFIVLFILQWQSILGVLFNLSQWNTQALVTGSISTMVAFALFLFTAHQLWFDLSPSRAWLVLQCVVSFAMLSLWANHVLFDFNRRNRSPQTDSANQPIEITPLVSFFFWFVLLLLSLAYLFQSSVPVPIAGHGLETDRNQNSLIRKALYRSPLIETLNPPIGWDLVKEHYLQTQQQEIQRFQLFQQQQLLKEPMLITAPYYTIDQEERNPTGEPTLESLQQQLIELREKGIREYERLEKKYQQREANILHQLTKTQRQLATLMYLSSISHDYSRSTDPFYSPPEHPTVYYKDASW
ncbi:hypothetical protein BY458DRAFT_552885 [Sporodiniella umbellata]|nr:hypothetical protein BY458DRAFT_552885 [Sporodiniella umbellata]